MNHSAIIREATDNSTSYVSHFIPMNDFVAINYLICAVAGIPLNLLTVVFIALRRRLHRTRNIMWLGVAFSNVLRQRVLRLPVPIPNGKEDLQLGGRFIPYASLALNLFLSLVDRYVCLAYSAWYMRKVTITWIISGQIGCFSILCVLTKSPYLLNFISLPERFTITDMKIFSTIGFIILLMCVVGQLGVYFKVKYYLDLEKDVYTSLSSHRRAHHNYIGRQRQTRTN